MTLVNSFTRKNVLRNCAFCLLATLAMVLVGCGSSSTVVTTASSAPGLAPSSTIAAGVEPFQIATCDLNGDGHLDLAVTDAYSNSIIILLGKGDGTFTTGTPVALAATDTTPVSIVCADFNSDGKADLALSNRNSGTVSVWLGKGDGTFSSAGASISIGTTSSPSFIATADFNGDGHPDLVIDSNIGLTILLGNGDGTFVASTVPEAANSGPLAIADFNGDGRMDIALVLGTTNLVILPGNGNGTFGTPIQTGFSVSGFISTADFNGDSNADLIVGGAILLGNGDGTFHEVQQSSNVPSGNFIALGDFGGTKTTEGANTFNTVDLAVLISNTQLVTVLDGNGDGTFSVPANHAYTTGQVPVSVVSGDFNGDGKTDFAVSNSFDGTVSIYLSK